MTDAITQVQSPRGILEWVNISGEGVESLSGKMQYKANVVLDPANNEDDAAFIAKIEKFWDANKPKGFKKKAKSNGIYLRDLIVDEDGEPVLDEDGEKQYKAIKDGGRVYIAFKTGTTWPDGNAKEVKIYNAKGKKVALGETKIGNNSEGRIGGMMDIYVTKSKQGMIQSAGVTLYLDKIQVAKLVEYQGGDEAMDAMDDEDGWSGPEEDTFEGSSEDSGAAKPRL